MARPRTTIHRLRRPVVVAALALALLAGDNLAAARGLSLIRDAEIEDTIRAYAEPLFAAAGLDPKAVQVHLVNDRSLNAFVAAGQRLFINTGLIMATERPNQLIAVIAHETGHISGGHLARKQAALRNLKVQSILAMVLGVGAAVASGKGAAAGAIALGGTEAAERMFLKYNRTEESAADQAALRFLDLTGQSSSGMLEFFEIIGGQDLLVGASQDPYVRSHPLTSERIASVRSHLARSPFADQPDPPEFVVAHDRMQAKLRGFLSSPKSTLRRYPTSDQSVVARYARAVAYHRRVELERALAEIDSLLAEQPNDPYFNELKGQILYENGKVIEAIAPYQRAVDFHPGSPLLMMGLAQAMIATDRPDLNAAAIPHLELAVARDRDLAGAWHQLAIAYGRGGDLGLSALASAEEHLAAGDYRSASRQARRAMKKLAEGSPAWLRAQDIEQVAKKEKKRKRGSRR